MVHHFPGVRAQRPTRLSIFVAAACVIAAAACTPSPDRDETVVDTTSETRPVAVEPSPPPPQAVLPDGSEITLELAITPDELAQGLMFRPHLPDDRGMLLIFAEERLPSIWMMNTLVALDLIYLDNSGTIVDLIANAQPCPGEPCPRFVPKRPARAVLEVPAGSIARHGLNVGQPLDFRRIPGFPVTDPS